MADKQEVPPPYASEAPVKEKSRNKKWMWGLTFYAGAVTAALITVCIFGSVYGWNNATTKAEDEESIKRYHTKYNNTEEDIEIDVNYDREIIRQVEPDGNLSIIVLDFKKNFGGVYNAKYGICMIMKDFENQLPHARNYSYFLDHADLNSDGVPTGEFRFDVNPAEPVDLTTLPAELIEPCWGKPVYGLTQKAVGSHVGREKRGILCFYIRTRVCGWSEWYQCYRCYYIYFYRCYF